MEDQEFNYDNINFEEYPETFTLNGSVFGYEIEVPTKLVLRSITIAHMFFATGKENNEPIPIFAFPKPISENNAHKFLNIASEYYSNMDIAVGHFYDIVKKNEASFADTLLFIEFANFADFKELYDMYCQYFAYLIRIGEINIDK